MTFFSDLAPTDGDEEAPASGPGGGAGAAVAEPTAAEPAGAANPRSLGGTAKLTVMAWLKVRVKASGLQKAVTADLAHSIGDGKVLLAVLQNFVGDNEEDSALFAATGDGDSDFKKVSPAM
jgi:hypothetical protein